MNIEPGQTVTVEVEGQFGKATLTGEEYTAWDRYIDARPWLLQRGGYLAVLAMFLSHYRRGINLNERLKGGAR